MRDLVRVTETSKFTVNRAEKKSRIGNPDTGNHFWNATKIVFKSLTYKNVFSYSILNYFQSHISCFVHFDSMERILLYILDPPQTMTFK